MGKKGVKSRSKTRFRRYLEGPRRGPGLCSPPKHTPPSTHPRKSSGKWKTTSPQILFFSTRLFGEGFAAQKACHGFGATQNYCKVTISARQKKAWHVEILQFQRRGRPGSSSHALRPRHAEFLQLQRMDRSVLQACGARKPRTRAPQSAQHTQHTAHAAHGARSTRRTQHSARSIHCTQHTMRALHTAHAPHSASNGICTQRTSHARHTARCAHCTQRTWHAAEHTQRKLHAAQSGRYRKARPCSGL